jgi:hypothetical protein
MRRLKTETLSELDSPFLVVFSIENLEAKISTPGTKAYQFLAVAMNL